MLRTSSRLKGDYQPYPSPPFGYSEEYAGNHLRGQLESIADAGQQHNSIQGCLSFLLYVRQIFASCSCGATLCTLMNLINDNYEYDYRYRWIKKAVKNTKIKAIFQGYKDKTSPI